MPTWEALQPWPGHLTEPSSPSSPEVLHGCPQRAGLPHPEMLRTRDGFSLSVGLGRGAQVAASSSRDTVVAALVVIAVRSDPGATFPRVGRDLKFPRCRRREGPSASVSFADVGAGEGRGPKAVCGQGSQRPGWTPCGSHSCRQARLGTTGGSGQRFPSPKERNYQTELVNPDSTPNTAQRSEASQEPAGTVVRGCIALSGPKSSGLAASCRTASGHFPVSPFPACTGFCTSGIT